MTKYLYFLIISLIITLIYIFIIYKVDTKYNIIERLGNYTGNYNSNNYFKVHPLFVKTKSDSSLEGPLEINFNPLGKKEYDYNIEMPCVPERDDYVPPTNLTKGYCKQMNILRDKKKNI